MSTDTLTPPSDTPSAPASVTPSVILRNLDDLPRPRGLPVLGNLLQVDSTKFHQQLEQWSKTLGPLFVVHMGRYKVLAVGDHEAVATSLRDRPDGFGRTIRLAEIWQEMSFDQGVFGANGDTWRKQRRMVMAGFDPGHVKAYFPSLKKVSLRLQGRWEKAASVQLTQPQASIELQPDLMRFTVDAIAGLAFGTDINTLESGEDIIQQHLDKIFPALGRRLLQPFPYWRFVRMPADRALDRSVIAVKAAIQGFIRQAREKLAADPSLREHPQNLLQAMIVAADQADSGVDDRDVAGNVLTMLLAGEDTTANTLAWMIYLLKSHPHALARAQEEVLRVAGNSAEFTPEKMAALDYIEACANETMRLKPVAPILPLQALRDTVLGDVRVPAGTVIINMLRRDSVSDSNFPDALTFNPDRWLKESASAQALSSAKRISMPFGAGPRMCPGRYLALLEMKMVMATLLSRFEITSVGTPGGGEPQEHLAFTMAPVGLQMRLRER